jgi:hypothetical protein
LKEIQQFDLSARGINDVIMPSGSTILGVGYIHHDLKIWAEIDPDKKTATRIFMVLMNGDKVPPGMNEYVGHAIFKDNSGLFHVYDLGEE